MNRMGFVSRTATVVLLALTVVAAGCATKKYVRNNIDPLETRVGKVEEDTSANAHRITDVDQRSMAGITEAKGQADTANQQATQAGQQAQQAQTLAQKGLSATAEVREELKNADNFQPVKTDTVLFGFNRSELNDEARKKLDDIATIASSTKRFVIEIQGFTDKTGPVDYNLELSRRRADAVVRYLTMDKKLPLARVYEVGYGKDSPVAPNNTREGREQNRRVEVKVLAVQQKMASQAQTQQ